MKTRPCPKKLCRKKVSHSIREDMVAWLDRVADIRFDGNRSRAIESHLKPAFDTRHSDRKRST